MFHMYFNSVTVESWSYILQAPHFEVQRSLEGGADSDLNVNSAALITGRRIFEAQRLSEQ